VEHTFSYYNLCNEISILEIRVDDLKESAKRVERKMCPPPAMRLVANYDGMPHSQMAPIQFEKLYQELQGMHEELTDIYDVLDLKYNYKRLMESRMSQLDGIEYKVAYERDVNRKSLAEISTEFNLSYDWIRKISSRVKRVRPA
jgi:hypothetical protein